MDNKNILDKFAKDNNLIYGIGSAEPFEKYRNILSKDVPFVNYSIEERINPALTLEGAKSLIALGLSYNFSFKRPNDNQLYASLSEGAVGEDYHITMTRYLNELAEALFKNTNEKYICLCDTGPLSDALVAKRCSLGSIGLNNGIISNRFGSMFFIGYIITTAHLQPTKSAVNKCNSCKICIKGCPTGALSENGFNYRLCTAYLTQKKGIIEDELKPLIGTYIYGCDICRRICPLTPKPQQTDSCAYPKIEDLLNLSNKQFNKIYGKTAIGWRGKRTILRNAIIVLGNIGDKRAIELIKPFTENENDDIRDAAIWSLKRLNEV